MTQIGFDEISKLELNDKFYEKTGRELTVYTIIKSPTLINSSESVAWDGRDETGEKVEFLITRGMEHYGPNIFI